MTTFLLLKIVLQWLRRRACTAQVRHSARGLVFHAAGVKTLYIVVILVSAASCAAMLGLDEPVWLAAIALFPGVGCIATWPADVIVNAFGLVQREWWGRARRIDWNDVAALFYRSRDGSTFVVAHDGMQIRHSGCHAASHRFQAEVMQRTGIRHIADWDAVPSLAG